MLKPIIKLRILQLYRAIYEIGFFRNLILFAIILFALFSLFLELSNKQNCYYISGIYFLLIFIIQIKRSDTSFLKIYFEKYKTIQFIEYIFLSIPLIIGLLINNYIILPIYFLLLLIVVNVNINIKKTIRNYKIQKIIPNYNFEWKAGLRKNFISILLIWFVGFITSFFIGSVPIAILVLTIVQIPFFEKGEDLQILLALEKNNKNFINYKIKSQLLLFSILILPLILAFLIFHFDKWYIIITEYFLLISLQMFFVILKYAFYQPGEKPAGIQIYSSFGIISIFMPPFLPVVWGLSIYLYLKTLKTLKFYLNDFN